jgi:hypothetical protein
MTVHLFADGEKDVLYSSSPKGWLGLKKKSDQRPQMVI